MRAFDLPCLEQVGFEADDLIATYVRMACERGATATIVSSDKDLMQLVTDCVTMYDTMKDRRIGIPEVIEKFGVPPEKVVEVQALAGDSTDNVPGVPGIGVKTAAQLIVEYGDLETLLFRAGEIKQPKRREALIENAEKARISRQLVLLDDKVELDVPLDELAVHEPDARKLIAFLKAMEFSTLTRRVADYSQIDPADIEPDAGNKSGASVFAPLPLAEGRTMRQRRNRSRRPEIGARARLPCGGPRTALRQAARQAGQGLEPQGHADLARRRARRGRAQDPGSIAASTRPIRSLDQLKAWIARVHDVGHFAIEAKAQLDRSDAGGDVAASRWRWRPTTPATSRSATSSPAAAPACSTPASRRTRSRPATRLTALRPLLESPGHPEDRLQHQVQRRDARAARHHAAQPRRRAADVLCARCRPQCARARGAGRALARPCHHRAMAS